VCGELTRSRPLCSHYYGDIPENDVFFQVRCWDSTFCGRPRLRAHTRWLVQTQILDHWIFYPMQLFCFNFGAFRR
jgi:hypothetical protein